MYRKIEEVQYERIQQSISRVKQVEEVRQVGEKRVTQIQQQLEEQKIKSKQKEEEIDLLKRCVLGIDLVHVGHDQKIFTVLETTSNV